ncbi:hypothetical protein [Vitiosangium sp. GDMCC 1.1324]|uniref:hypothetical protein n=1 Tax=Vitiosangium sp. (strain GDMCC 1.1324) TaxID=2138576 RepID=UPI000D37589A|nr:hypothetical protein [Vitiosangium sp. GDMCC 1.1324]PTL85542.1 hypothetical protein DAT35_02150 [Vitiosangium sp. GDMCC 1.1324]
MRYEGLLLVVSILFSMGCGHDRSAVLRVPATPAGQERPAPGLETEDEGVRVKGGTLSSRISVLIANGEFAEAEALIAEGTASGLLSQPQAARLLERIAQLNTKLGELPARLQRAPDFPSQLKDYTLFQIKRMLEAGDFSLATEPQLRMAKKLLENPDRLMDKVR